VPPSGQFLRSTASAALHRYQGHRPGHRDDPWPRGTLWNYTYAAGGNKLSGEFRVIAVDGPAPAIGAPRRCAGEVSAQADTLAKFMRGAGAEAAAAGRAFAGGALSLAIAIDHRTARARCADRAADHAQERRAGTVQGSSSTAHAAQIIAWTLAIRCDPAAPDLLKIVFGPDRCRRITRRVASGCSACAEGFYKHLVRSRRRQMTICRA